MSRTTWFKAIFISFGNGGRDGGAARDRGSSVKGSNGAPASAAAPTRLSGETITTETVMPASAWGKGLSRAW
jgi:hypothetical protein